jgi:hypothetical protein
LEEFYRQSKNEGKPFEIIYASLDRSKEEYTQSLSQKHGPWLALGFKDPYISSLQTQFGVRGVPTLLVLNASDSKILSREGKKDIQSLGQGAWQKWDKERGGSLPSAIGTWHTITSWFSSKDN